MPKNSYYTASTDKFFTVARSIIEQEIDLSSTVTMFNLVDISKLEGIRKSLGSNKPSYTVFIARAVAIALNDFPEMNKRFYRPFGILPTKFQIFKNVDIAVASEVTNPKLAHVAYIGVINDVQSKSLSQIQDWLLRFRQTDSVEQWTLYSSLIQRLPVFLAKLVVRMPVLLPTLWVKYRGGACIISSPAKYGVDGLVAAWSAPLGISFGYAKERAIVRNGQVVSAPTFNLTLNFDRRMFSGAQGARLISRISEILEKGEFGEDQNLTGKSTSKHSSQQGAGH